MISNDEYMKIAKDIAGSRTKNRFMYEMMFGIKTMYDLYLKKTDFFMIFDYACDIEIAKENYISFYQLKTTSVAYSINKLLNKKKSILQKLVNLKVSSAVKEVYIVSNMGITGADTKDKVFSNMEQVCFSDFPESIKDKIIKKIDWPNDVPFLESIHFINSELCVKKLSVSLLGYTTKFLNELFCGTPSLPEQFQKTILSVVMDKANYEYDTLTLEETIEKKGITKNNLEMLIRQYHDTVIHSSNITYETVKKYCNELNLTINESVDVKKAYSFFLGKGYFDTNTKEILNGLESCYSTTKYKYLKRLDAIKKIVIEYNFEGKFTNGEKLFLAICAYERLGGME